MSKISALATALGSAMDLLAEAAAEPARVELLPVPVAKRVRKLVDVYFGTTCFSKKQRQAVAAARANDHDLPTLEVIERYARRAETQTVAWNFRLQMCQTRADAVQMEVLAREKMPPKEKKEEPGVRLRRGKKYWTWAVTGPSDLVAELHNQAKTLTEVEELFSTGAAKSEVVTNVVINLNELVKVCFDEEEVTLRLTNGSTLTGAQLVERTLAECGLVTLIHPVEGPINLYRAERFASWKQRQMAAAENPMCPWPGCYKPADECQVHHLQAWIQGGETNPKNLTTACKYHNRVNADDPNAPPKRGRLARVNGKIQWVPPWAAAR